MTEIPLQAEPDRPDIPLQAGPDMPPQSGPDNAAFLELEERYRQLAEQSPDAIAIHQGGHMVYLNPAGAQLLGADTPDAVLGMSVLDFVHPDMLPMARERARQVVGNRMLAEPIEERMV